MDLDHMFMAAVTAAMAKLWLWGSGIQKQLDDCKEDRTNLKIEIQRLNGRIDVLSDMNAKNNTHCSMWVMVDPHGILVNVGGDAMQMLGCSAAALIGKHMSVLLHDPEQIELHKRIFDGAVSNVRKTSVVGMLKRQDGKEPLEVVVKLAEGKFQGTPVIHGYVFEVPFILQSE